MLFNSYEFLFAFLPITMLGFFLLAYLRRPQLVLCWLVLASLFFYGWWSPKCLWIIVASILGNYAVGRRLESSRQSRSTAAKGLLAAGLVGNLVLLGYFKYANFFVENLQALGSADFHWTQIVLPIGISFFTFQQIAYLVDAYRGEMESKGGFLSYCLFVTFFPQLIAGPIVHHKEILHQFGDRQFGVLRSSDLSFGITVLVIGLFKKVVIADGVAEFANPVFAAAQSGITVSCVEAWCGALAYALQIYFDFSGYSDMAIGLGRMFGIRLPLNFDSPYKALSIADFWHRWHMTLSRFLRDYLYIPLGGNRNGKVRTHVNLMATMLLGGLWHGAGWTFLFWGGLHGAYLIANHGWRSLRRRIGLTETATSPIGRLFAWPLTFVCVLVAWVFFRAESFASASSLLSSMFALEGFTVPAGIANRLPGLDHALVSVGATIQGDVVLSSGQFLNATIAIVGLLLFCVFAPNTSQVVRQMTTEESPDQRLALAWQPNPRWGVVMAFVAVFVVLQMSRVSDFLYFQF